MKSKSVLIIDDDSRNVFALCTVLQSKGYVCVSAPDAKNGILLLEQNPDIGIVLLDMMMPDMDGYQAIEVIRGKPDLADLPIVSVTAQAMTGDREKCLEAGADAYVAKPIDVELLLEILNKHIL